MWVLTNSTTEECFYLIPEKAKYSVGRVGADLALDDKSISRMHAHLYITPERTLTLEDVGSKYGTFCNEGIDSKSVIEKRQHIELHAGDRIRFGVLENLWNVSQHQLVSVTSALPRDKATELTQQLSALGGRITSHCDVDGGSTPTHLTMNELSVTVKVLHALLQQIPIVSCDYWRDLLQTARRGSGSLPQAKDYSPPRSEQLLQAHHDVDIGARPERQHLFVGMTFVFMNRKHFEIYSPIVQKAGGTCKDLKCGVQKPFLLKPNVVVVQYVSTTETQGSQTICSIAEYLESHSRRLIPEYEIGLAIVDCSTSKYCNPDYKILGDLMPPSSMSFVETADDGDTFEAAFIENTNSPPKQNSESMTDMLVPETEQSNASNSMKNAGGIDCDMPEMHVTESAAREENQNKRSRDLVDDNKDDDQNNENLFHFTKKPHLDAVAKSTENANEQSGNTIEVPVIPKIPPPAPDEYGFFGKSQVGPRRSEIGQPTDNANTMEQATNTRKRQRIAVLSDGDGDEDDNELFGFGGASGAKSARLEECGNDADEDLFGFTKHASKDCVDKAAADGNNDGDDLDPTQVFLPKGKPKSNVAIKIPQRKLLPREVNTAGWLSCSLNRMELKVEPKTDADDEPKLETDGLSKTDLSATIKKEEGAEEDVSSLWVKSLKGGFHVRKSSVNTTSRSKEVTSSTSHDEPDLSIALAGSNFKAFVKKSNPHPQQKIIATVRAATFPLRLR